MKHRANVWIRATAQGLTGYLLLLYVVCLPVHLHVHSDVISSSESHQDDSPLPGENTCLVCDWWVHQQSAEEGVSFQLLRTGTPYVYYSPIYCLPPMVLAEFSDARAPPAQS